MAKMYWGINASPRPPGGTVQAQLGRFAVGRSPRVAQGDSVILFSSTREDLKFWGLGEVLGVHSSTNAERRTPDDLDVLEYVTEVKVTEALDPPRSLGDLAYSLRRVRRHDKPGVHYNKRYVSMLGVDAETIKRNEIHGGRAAIGILASALGRDECLTIAPMLLAGGNVDYAEVFRRLKEYVWSHYVSFASLVVRTSEQISTIEGQPIESVIFVAENGSDVANLGRLKKICAPVVEATEESSEDPFEALLQQETSGRLRRVFPVTQDDLLLLLQVRR